LHKKEFCGAKMETEIAGATFTAYLALVLKITLEKQAIQRGRYYWKLNRPLLQDEGISQRFETEWKT
jgi:hypothetical protein